MALHEITSCADVDDFPNGGFHLRIDGEYKETNLPCEVCNGVRNAIAHVFRMTIERVIIDDREMSWREFCELHPQTGNKLNEELNIGKFVSPVCTACQDDFYLAGKHTYTAPADNK